MWQAQQLRRQSAAVARPSERGPTLDSAIDALAHARRHRSTCRTPECLHTDTTRPVAPRPAARNPSDGARAIASPHAIVSQNASIWGPVAGMSWRRWPGTSRLARGTRNRSRSVPARAVCRVVLVDCAHNPVTRARIEVPRPAFLFDLDGTLVDSVYQHVIACKRRWRSAAGRSRCGGIHRRIELAIHHTDAEREYAYPSSLRSPPARSPAG